MPVPSWLAAHRVSVPAVGWGELVGDAARRARAISLATELAGGAVPAVLLTGETGNGKTHLAAIMTSAWIEQNPAGEVYILPAAKLSAARCRELAKLPATAPRLLVLDGVERWALHRQALVHSTTTRATLRAAVDLLDANSAERGLACLLLSRASADRLDPALLAAGRIERTFDLPYPDAAARAELFSFFFARSPLPALIDSARAAALVGASTSVSEIADFVTAAADAASCEGRARIEWRDLRGAVADFASESEEELAQLRNAALHEAGHAVVAARLGLLPLNVVIEGGRGVTEIAACDSNTPTTDAAAAARIATAMAGTVAERLLGSGVLLAATDDHERASEWALSRLRSGLDPALPAAALSRFESSPAAADAVHAAVAVQLRSGRRVAEQLVRREAAAIRRCATLLLRERQLSGALLADAVAPHQRSIGQLLAERARTQLSLVRRGISTSRI